MKKPAKADFPRKRWGVKRAPLYHQKRRLWWEIFFQKLVSDDLKWSEMPKKHDFQIFIFGEKFTSPTRNEDRGGKFCFQKLVSDDLKCSEMPKKHDF